MFDESAVLFRMFPEPLKPADPSFAWLIVVMSGPVRFSTHNAVVGSVLTRQSTFMARPGTRLVTPTRVAP